MEILKWVFPLLILYPILLIFFGNKQINNNLLSQDHNPVALFLFGDSLFDAGNNNYLQDAIGRANVLPYGQNYFKHPTGRASDGRIIPDFIAEYLKLPFITPYLEPKNHDFTKGVNFASGGAGALVETLPGQVIDLKTQVSYFKKVVKQLRQKLHHKETNLLLSKAIYLISIGGNDYGVYFASSSREKEDEYVNMVIGNVTDVIKEIYEEGGRKFGFVNVGEIGCLPNFREINPRGDCFEQLSNLAKSHNQNFPVIMENLQNKLDGFKFAIFDYYKELSERINDPSKYGFKEAKAACCGSGRYRGMLTCGKKKGEEKLYELCDNPKEYLFFDIHPTENAYKQFAKLMWNGSSDAISPYNLKQLFET